MSLNSSINHFFKEFPDTDKGTKFWAMLLFVMLLIILGIYSNFRNDPDIAFACIMYAFMVVTCGVVGGMDWLKESNVFTGNYLSGKWKYYGLVPLIIGMIFGYFMVTQNQTIGMSFLQLSGTQAFIFIVLVAPVVEEWFFRWAAFPSLYNSFKGITKYHGVAALLLVNFGFGLFHYYIYGANIAAVYVAAFLGIVYTVGNYALKSGTFSIGSHMANNYLLWAAAGGVLFG